jgi:hypothetical protein
MGLLCIFAKMSWPPACGSVLGSCLPLIPMSVPLLVTHCLNDSVTVSLKIKERASFQLTLQDYVGYLYKFKVSM